MGIKNWKGEINKARHKQYFWCNTCFEGYSRNMTKGRDALVCRTPYVIETEWFYASLKGP
eukprot:1161060-Pelagomonas_calceolata.AAC.1